MNLSKNPRLSVFTYGIIAYMILAFGWWSVLLYTKNRDAYIAKVELQGVLAAVEGLASSPEEFRETARFRELNQAYQRQEWMILGESLVLTISLLFGLYMIHRSYRREVSAAKQQRNFLLSITHELKSPIAGIRLVLETFLRRNLPEDKARKLSINALKETDRLTDLVEDLLLSAKLEQAFQIHEESIDLAGLLKEQIAEKEIKYPHAQFHLHLHEIPLVMRGDRSGITSVVVNLLENAAKYSQPHPEINVHLERKGDTVFFTVADNGIGIPKPEKTQIFNKFYRVGNEDTRQAKGTGLGLYIVREIVRAHRGKITVQDNAGGGTLFQIQLPVGDTTKAQLSTAKAVT